MTESWCMAENISKSGDQRPKPCPPLDEAKGISFQRPPSLFVIVRQKFRFVGCNIDVRRAFRLAGLARKAQFQRVLNVFVSPAVAYHLALEKLEKHVSAP